MIGFNKVVLAGLLVPRPQGMAIRIDRVVAGKRRIQIINLVDAGSHLAGIADDSPILVEGRLVVRNSKVVRVEVESVRTIGGGI